MPFPSLLKLAIGVSLFISHAVSSLVLFNATTSLENATFNTVDIEYIPSIFYLNHSDTNATLAPSRKRISYFVRDGLAIVEGDVILSTEADVLASTVTDDNTPQVEKEKRSLSIFPAAPLVNPRKWPNGRFEYKWANAESKTQRGPGFDAAVKLWTDRVPSLQFVEVASPSEDLIGGGGAITLKSVDDFVSSSPAGRAMNLAGTQFVKESNIMILGNCGTVADCGSLYAHEIGHSLGLKHEHKRPDRDAYMTLNCDNILDAKEKKSNGDEVFIKAVCGSDATCEGFGCQFTTVDPLEFSWAGAYDLKSIMHYSADLFQKSFGLTVLDAKPGLVIDPADVPTLIDANRICDIYWEVCRGVCGDGIVSGNNGEECDDGNNDDGDGCSASCKKEPAVCGNNIVEPGEECDDGNLVDGDGCTSTCKREFCGDGIVQPALGEQCDEGSANGGTGVPCDSGCRRPCIATCDPTAGKNLCAPGTSCIRLDEAVGLNAGKFLCACAHGFRATGVNAADATLQIRVPGAQWPSQANRVFVQPGTECGQVCDRWTLGRDPCDEVIEQPQCF